jgi:alpha-mannosidase
MAARHVIHVISNTHWDREWLFPFQETRMMLVDFLDGLLNVMETQPEYRSFVLDSQTVPLEDYLEVRPENRARVEKVVADGRLLVGPWYTCPEGFEVNGESLVRNLLTGHRVAKSFGGVMKVGHTPFSYGQNSQMPQIYAGFGIDTILFYHGISHEETPNEFLLEGADGTRILGSQMSSGARYNFYHHVYRAALYGKAIADRECTWDELGLPFHRCAPDRAPGHHFLLDPKRGFDREKIAERVKWLRENERKFATTRHLAFMNGHDSSVADPVEAEMIRETAKALAPDKVIHDAYPEMLKAIRAEVKWDELQVLRGEQRVPKPMPVTMHLYSDVLSSRTRMKALASRAEYLLQRRAEPFAAMAAWAGAEYPRAFLDLAWKTLLQCHAHDSISGSGVDAIEEDMMHRLRQVIHICEGVITRSLGDLQLRIDTTRKTKADDVLLSVFNPLPQSRSEVVTAVLDLPYTGPRGEFALVDLETGKPVTVQVAGRKPHWAIVNHAWDAPAMMKSERFTVHLDAAKLPAMGFATFRVDRSKMFDRGSLVTAANTMENEHLRVAIKTDGTLSVTHKAGGVTYDDLNYFLDNGEAGHAWMHHNPAVDQCIDSRGFPVRVALEEDGPLLARYRVEVDMIVPAGLDENGGDPWQRLDGIGSSASRSRDTVPLTVTSRITLRRGAKSVEVSLCFDNTARNHRLRVMLPTRRAGRTCHAESAFDVVERETAFSKGSQWYGCRGVTFPMQRFVDVSDKKGGLAFIAEGLREYEVTQDTDRAIAVTLMRAYEVSLTTVSCRWDAHPEMTLSQSPGAHAFTYLIHPHAGDYAAGAVIEEADAFVAPVDPAQAGVHGGTLPCRHGFAEVAPGTLIVTAVKPAEDGDGWVLRLSNPTEKAVKGTVRFARRPAAVQLVTLEEVGGSTLKLAGSALSVKVEPKKIVTLRVRPA